MKAIMVMYDSLNRHMLPPYGCDWVHAPNFERLAARVATFNRAYIGSNPTIPTRRELHTGRHNFLHRSWGPLEPFDDSMPELLKQAGIYTCLVSDGYHYWEDGGATYHGRYNAWEFFRGQECDAWKGVATDFTRPGTFRAAEIVNRPFVQEEEQWPQHQTFEAGLEFLHRNQAEDNWFLQIETFDPHEPYWVPEKYQALYPHDYDGPEFYWPNYVEVTEPPEQVEHCRLLNAALISMCDASLGKVLDAMDELSLWGDTMLIVNTDHGFLLGEHGYWGKMVMPMYEEISHTPLFIWDPRSQVADERRDALVQTIDLAPTLLEYFGQPIPGDMQGKPLRETVATDAPVRETALFGQHGGHLYCTDGRYVYKRAPVSEDNQPLYEYTMMPTHMRAMFRTDELQDIELAGPFSFTKGCKLMRTPRRGLPDPIEAGNHLWDLESEPAQSNTIEDATVEERMIEQMKCLLDESDAPEEQYERLGLGG